MTTLLIGISWNVLIELYDIIANIQSRSKYMKCVNLFLIVNKKAWYKNSQQVNWIWLSATSILISEIIVRAMAIKEVRHRDIDLDIFSWNSFISWDCNWVIGFLYEKNLLTIRFITWLSNKFFYKFVCFKLNTSNLHLK